MIDDFGYTWKVDQNENFCRNKRNKKEKKKEADIIIWELHGG